MYTTLPHLQSAIRTQLQRSEVCRIYKESINACWPNLSDNAQLEKMTLFAERNHWSVSCRTLGNLGVVAEFAKAT
ncbi:hypothetical protein CfE428DRAFT_1537 [Chthoniobacter flavus Ellin428]|uniref:Uncharacterized protein n=1 Tax=Chthoniobacter flavus Ellin428 TaxID=497964 RepID=B4CY96_9BACT|nr:hypothetical protein [Chthoniobacter flavus]EDY21244.1 hypothetical protein CfE428DRAFT_1537 [Chthoniobacter flavus Ellin428]TCO87612.1 hypothetical protein EV701_121114 [Chthoniobacter flavus]